jgi:hypothetical protein
MYLHTSQRNKTKFVIKTRYLFAFEHGEKILNKYKTYSKDYFYFCLWPKSSCEPGELIQCNKQAMQWKTVVRFPEESVRPPLSPRSNQACDPLSLPRSVYQEWRISACDTEHSHFLVLRLNIHHDIFLHSPVGFPMPWCLIQHRCNFSCITGLHILSLNLQPHCYKANPMQGI